MWTICNLAKTNLCKALAPVSMSMRFFIGKKKSMSMSLLTKLSNYKSCLSYEVLVFLVVRFLLFAPCFTRLLHSSACSSGDWATDRVTSYIMRDRHSLRPVVDSLHPKATVFLAPEKKEDYLEPWWSIIVQTSRGLFVSCCFISWSECSPLSCWLFWGTGLFWGSTPAPNASYFKILKKKSKKNAS